MGRGSDVKVGMHAARFQHSSIIHTEGNIGSFTTYIGPAVL